MSLRDVVSVSAKRLINQMFDRCDYPIKGKLNSVSVSSKFKIQLNDLMEKLRRNVSHQYLYTSFYIYTVFLAFLIGNEVYTVH